MSGRNAPRDRDPPPSTRVMFYTKHPLANSKSKDLVEATKAAVQSDSLSEHMIRCVDKSWKSERERAKQAEKRWYTSLRLRLGRGVQAKEDWRLQSHCVPPRALATAVTRAPLAATTGRVGVLIEIQAFLQDLSPYR